MDYLLQLLATYCNYHLHICYILQLRALNLQSYPLHLSLAYYSNLLPGTAISYQLARVAITGIAIIGFDLAGVAIVGAVIVGVDILGLAISGLAAAGLAIACVTF